LLKLPDPATDEGAETLLLLAECRGPSFPGYSLKDATTCMQLMDLVLWNRVDNPAPFLAKDRLLLSVMRARGQFQGFENYPACDESFSHRIQQMVDIANDPEDRRSRDFTDFINAAIDVARADTIPETSLGKLTAWRTAGSGSPGKGFTLFKQISGIEFYWH
jgi:hypothetical protein